MKTKLFFNCILLILFVNFSYGQDWPNLNKYKNENAKVSVLSAKENKRVVFMGNSITDGWVKGLIFL